MDRVHGYSSGKKLSVNGESEFPFGENVKTESQDEESENVDDDHRDLSLWSKQDLMESVVRLENDVVDLDLRLSFMYVKWENADEKLTEANKMVQSKKNVLAWLKEKNRELKMQLENERLKHQKKMEGAETMKTLEAEAEQKYLTLESENNVLKKDLQEEKNKRTKAEEELARLKNMPGVINAENGFDEKTQVSSSRASRDQEVVQNFGNQDANAVGEEDDEVMAVPEFMIKPSNKTRRMEQSLNTSPSKTPLDRELVASGKRRVHENQKKNQSKFQNKDKKNFGRSRKVVRKPRASFTGTRQQVATKWLPFSCTNCKARYQRVSQLNLHRRRKHNIKAGFEIGCVKCGTVYKSRKEHARHRVEVHGYRTPLPEKKTNKKGGKSRAAPNTKVRVVEETRNSVSPIKHAVDHTKNSGHYCICGKTYKNIKKLIWHTRGQKPQKLKPRV